MDKPPHAHAVVVAHGEAARVVVETVETVHLECLGVFAGEFVHLPGKAEVEVFGRGLGLFLSMYCQI